MILEEATKEAFGYYPSELEPQSSKHVLAICNGCGKIRITRKNRDCTMCLSCAKKGENNPMSGKPHTEEHNRKIGAAMKGEKGPNWRGGSIKCGCLQCGKEFPAKPSEIKRGNGKYCCKKCFDDAQFECGRKISYGRNNAKRKRQLGYTLLLPLEEDEVRHHVTNEHVIGIPKEVHEKLSGRSRKKHRALALEWLKDNDRKKYEIVLNVLMKAM